MKRTVPQLADFLSELTGLSETLHQQQARRAREAGYLSQAGHGRGAAAATAMDAAMMLLIAGAGLSSRYAEVVAAALDATKPNREHARSLNIEGSNAVEMVESLIERRHNVSEVRVGIGKGIYIQFRQEQPEDGEPGYISCGANANSPSAKRLLKVQNRVPMSDPGMATEAYLRPWVFEEIAKYLGIEWVDTDA
jgi:hypothetical protein